MSIAPEGEYAGAIINSNTAGAGGILVNFSGNGGLIFASPTSSYVAQTLQVNGGAVFVGTGDPAAAGQTGPFGSGAAALQIGTSATSGGANLGFMTYGANAGVGPAPTIITNRSLVVGGNGAPSTGVVLGGFTDDYTAINGSITLNGSATFTANGPAAGGRVDFNGTISGSGAVAVGNGSSTSVEGDSNANGIKGIQLLNNGTVVFAGANGYTGPTTINNGELYVNGSLNAASAVSVLSGATLGGKGTVNGAVTVQAGGMLEGGQMGSGTLTVGGGLSFTGSGSAINFGGLATTGGPGIKINGSLSISNPVMIDVTGAIPATGDYPLISSSSPNLVAGNFAVGTLPGRASATPMVSGGELFLDVTALYSVAWTGSNGSDWNAAGNFIQMGGVDPYSKFQPGDAVVFSNTAANTSVTLNTGNVVPSSVTFSNSTATYTLSGSNGISGVTGLSVTGGGLVVLTNTNTYSGPTTISAGTLQLGTGTAGQDGSIYYTSRISNSGALVYDLAGSQTYGGVISGSGSLTKAGGGALVLTNADAASATTISGGTLQLGLGSYGNDGTLGGPITDNGVLVANYFGTQTLSGSINGTGTLTKAGPGTLILTNVESYGGGTTISAGTLQLGNGATNGSLAGNVAVAAGAGLAIDNPLPLTCGGVISGSGGLTMLGASTLTLTNANTYTGGTTISSGTLQLGNGTTNGSLSATGLVTNNSALVFDPGATQSYGGVITGGGALAKLGAGTLYLTGSTNSYGGGTSLSAGALNFVAGAIPSGAGTISFNGGTLQWAAGNTQDVSASIAAIASGQAAILDTGSNSVTFNTGLSGPGGLTKLGAGTLTLAASNGYGGATAVNGGTLVALNTASLPGYAAGLISVSGSASMLVVEAGNNPGEFGVNDITNLLATASFSGNANFGIQVVSPETFVEPSGLNGSFGFVKLGGGVFDLNGVANYSGSTKVNGGVLVAGSTSSLAGYSTSLSASSVSVAAGSTLAVQEGTQPGEFGTSDINNVLGTAKFASGANFGIQVVAPESVSYGGPGNSISGSLGLMMLGSGTLTLGGANSYSGSTTISSGVLAVAGSVGSGVAGPLGSSTSAIALGDANSGTSPVELAISGGYAIGRNVLVGAGTNSSAPATLASLTNANATYSGTITLNSSLNIASAATGSNALTFSGSLVNGSGTANGVTLTGPGNVVFSGSAGESYSGPTNVNGGTLTVGPSTWLPATTLSQSGSSLVSLQYAGTQALNGLYGSPGTALNLKSSSALVVGSGAYGGSISGVAALLTKTTSGTLILSGSNSYSGPTTISGNPQGGRGQRVLTHLGVDNQRRHARRHGLSPKGRRAGGRQFGDSGPDDRDRFEQHRGGQPGWHAQPLRQSHRRDRRTDGLRVSHRHIRQPEPQWPRLERNTGLREQRALLDRGNQHLGPGGLDQFRFAGPRDAQPYPIGKRHHRPHRRHVGDRFQRGDQRGGHGLGQWQRTGGGRAINVRDRYHRPGQCHRFLQRHGPGAEQRRRRSWRRPQQRGRRAGKRPKPDLDQRDGYGGRKPAGDSFTGQRWTSDGWSDGSRRGWHDHSDLDRGR